MNNLRSVLGPSTPLSRASSLALATLCMAAVACGSYSSGPHGSGGGAATGGSSTGGATGTGGGNATGGSNATGGATATGGGIGTTGGTGTTGGATGGENKGGRGGSPGETGGTGPGGNRATGGAIATGGQGGQGGGGGKAGGTGGTGPTLPCDVLNAAAGNKCVSAHSTVRVIVSGYTGPLYQLCKGTAAAGPSSCKGTPQDIGSKDGYADAAAHDAFCTGGTCTITKIYDQSGQGNHLEPAPRGGAKGSPDSPANASELKITINGHPAYGVKIKAGIGYRTGCTACNIKQGNGMVKGDNPETQYWVTSQKDLIDGCCFDYGNAETSSNDDGNGTMETLYFGGGVVWGTGSGGKPGPWMMADLENGLYAGWEKGQDKNISTNTPLKYDFVTGILLGDTREKNSNKGRFAIYGGDAANGALKTLYDGIRPEKPGYVPMQKQGSIILGIGGDNSNSAGGHFYEGAVSAGPVISKEVADALQAAIVSANYGK